MIKKNWLLNQRKISSVIASARIILLSTVHISSTNWSMLKFQTLYRNIIWSFRLKCFNSSTFFWLVVQFISLSKAKLDQTQLLRSSSAVVWEITREKQCALMKYGIWYKSFVSISGVIGPRNIYTNFNLVQNGRNQNRISKICDLVLIRMDNTSALQWVLSQATELFPGTNLSVNS